MRVDFEWDPAKAASNAIKRGVSFAEAMTEFGDPLARSILDIDHGAREERWVTLDLASTGNLLVVVDTWADIDADRSAVRVISARRPTHREARQYRESGAP